MTDLDIEFEHIFLEVKAERWHSIERFYFSYFCFRENYLTKKGKPDWELARQRCPRSRSLTIIKHAELEPLVPHEVITGEIKRYWRDGLLTPRALRRILDSLLDYATITKAEKNVLKQAGLLNAMPAFWYQSKDKSPISRFAAANIEMQDQSRD
ncbi:hypothetical protein B6A42_10925 [Vibrio coralliilyticus]|uniref:hypothetical protein n=1 Tax=Vibrio coralliilyticus TaxID=190893 RepID=UPI0009C32F75|nr:hypothetical protein [Vibrio coralliilyticus]ARC92490.1 hypothetical protein B6A42_10925 [Vibrio coralliilyticus]NOI58075.1 hypothetical protein [Vibrio coralliilyticus]PAT66834.1 hypothetical protein CKA27_16830 [Vibrio coralliilyticus]